MKMKKYKAKRKIKESRSDIVFNVFNTGFLLILFAVTLYPFIYTFSNSFSEPMAVMRNEVVLFPVGFSLESYQYVLTNPEVYTAYFNTIWYVVVGTIISVTISLMMAYPLSRKSFFIRNQVMVYVAITMFFSGGLIPSFLVVKNLGLYNTRWAIVLPPAISAWNVIIARTYLQSNMPDSMYDSAYLDGANDLHIFWKIVLPLSKPIIAVLVLFSAVSRWNSYFDSLVYLSNKALQPMQLFLRRILIVANDAQMEELASSTSLMKAAVGEQMKFAVIIITILPIIVIYPYLQKYFVKGVMIGAIKG